jgi:predicted nucleic acid-binding Zn ribbon protein
MRTVTQPRLRSSSGHNASAVLHCMICCAEMPVSTLRKTCGPECRKIFKRMRRAVQSVRCWVTLFGGPGKRLLLWLPRKSVMRSDNPLSGASRAHRAIPWKKTTRTSKRPSNG